MLLENYIYLAVLRRYVIQNRSQAHVILCEDNLQRSVINFSKNVISDDNY